MKNLLLFLLLATALIAAPTTPINNVVIQKNGAALTGVIQQNGATAADSAGLTSGRVPFATTGGLLTDDSDMTFATDTLTVTKGTFGGITHVANAIGAVSTITGTTGNMTVTAGTGNSRTLALQSTTSGGTATTFLTGNADQTLTIPGSLIRTPATITITANAGTWNIANGLSLATNNAATTLTPSGDGTNGQFALVNLINSDASNARVFTFDTVTDFGITAAANRTTSVLLMSTGSGSGWLPYGGSPSLLDAAADTTPASTKLIGTWDATSGVLGKSTIAQVATTVRATITQKIATFVLDGAGSAITTTTVPGTSMTDGAYTLTGWSISATGATGTITVKFWNKAYSTAIPTVANVINTSGVSLSSGTSVYSTTLSDFTDTTYAAQDQFRCSVTAVDGAATDLTVTLYGTRL